MWIETQIRQTQSPDYRLVTPRTGVWIETFDFEPLAEKIGVTPRTGVWIETINNECFVIVTHVTPRTGVWIETFVIGRRRLRRRRHTPHGCVD